MGNGLDPGQEKVEWSCLQWSGLLGPGISCGLEMTFLRVRRIERNANGCEELSELSESSRRPGCAHSGAQTRLDEVQTVKALFLQNVQVQVRDLGPTRVD